MRWLNEWKKYILETRELHDDEIPDAVYHTTFLGRAQYIQATGLMPSAGSQFSGGYDSHSKGRIFFSDFEGVRYWISKMEDIAQYNTDTLDSSWQPIVLAFDPTNLTVKLFEDELGSKDSYASAYFSIEPIPSDELYIWDGSEWESLSDADLESMQDESSENAERESNFEDYDDEDFNEEDENIIDLNWNLFRPRRRLWE